MIIRVFDRLLKRVVETIETPCKSITHLIEINAVNNLYLSIDKSGPVYLWNFQYVGGMARDVSASGKTIPIFMEITQTQNKQQTYQRLKP